MIRFRNVTKQYPRGKRALHDVSLYVESGEMVFVTGRSGAGKTTLLKLIMCREACSYGQIILGEKDLNKIPKRQIPYLRRQIGLISQNPYLIEERTVFQNVALPLVVAGYSQEDIAKRVRAALDKVGLLGKEWAYPGEISAGENQRVGIARAVVNRPTILLADEPTGNLDPQLSKEIMQLLAQFHQVGVTVIIVTHDIDLVSALQARTLRLHDGKLIHDTHQNIHYRDLIV